MTSQIYDDSSEKFNNDTNKYDYNNYDREVNESNGNSYHHLRADDDDYPRLESTVSASYRSTLNDQSQHFSDQYANFEARPSFSRESKCFEKSFEVDFNDDSSHAKHHKKERNVCSTDEYKNEGKSDFSDKLGYFDSTKGGLDYDQRYREERLSNKQRESWYSGEREAKILDQDKLRKIDPFMNNDANKYSNAEENGNEIDKSGIKNDRKPTDDQKDDNYVMKSFTNSKPIDVLDSRVVQDRLDLIAHKESLFEATREIKAITQFMCKVDQHIVDEADIDIKALRSYQHLLPNIRINGGLRNLKYPTEGEKLEKYNKDLIKIIMQTFQSIAECINQRKDAYQGLVKRMRETSNFAIRNAIQAEKLESMASISHLRLILETEMKSLITKTDQQLNDSESVRLRLMNELEIARENIIKFQEKEISSSEESVRAVSRALLLQREGAEKEKEAQQKWLVEDNKRLKVEASAQIEVSLLQHKIYSDAQRVQYEEALGLLVGDRRRLEGDVEKLRSDLLHSQAMLGSEKQSNAAHRNEEKINHEREMLETRSESVKKQAYLKTETISALQRAKCEEERKHSEYEKKITKDREAVMTNHMMDEEKSQHRFNIEKKRLIANLESKYQNQLVALKRTHEQELTIITKENLRLQRSAARSSGAKNSSDDLRRENDGRTDGRARSTDSYPFNETDLKMNNKDTNPGYLSTRVARYGSDEPEKQPKNDKSSLYRNNIGFPAKFDENGDVYQEDKIRMEEKNTIYDEKFTINDDRNVQSNSINYLDDNDDDDDDDSLSDDYNDKKKKSLQKTNNFIKNNPEKIHLVDEIDKNDENEMNDGNSNDNVNENDYCDNDHDDFYNAHNHKDIDNNYVGRINNRSYQNDDDRDNIDLKSENEVSNDNKLVFKNKCQKTVSKSEEYLKETTGYDKVTDHVNLMNDDSSSEFISTNGTCSSYVTDDVKEKEGNLFAYIFIFI
jgi:hypothetical protein